MLSGKSAIVTGSTSGIGLGIARGLAASGANVVLNGFGDPGEIEAIRADLANGHNVRVLYSGADMADDERDRRHDRATPSKRIRRRRHPRQQCRHPVCRADRGFPGREMECDPRHQPLQRVSRHAPRGARHEEEVLGPHRQHRLGARAGRLALQVGLCVGQARHRRLDQDRSARSRRAWHHRQCGLPGLCADAAGREADPGDGQGARHHRAAGDLATCCSRRSRPSASSPSTRSRPLVERFSAPTTPARSPAPRCRSTAAGPLTDKGDYRCARQTS